MAGQQVDEAAARDSMRVDGDGKVVEWRCHYGFAFFEAWDAKART